MAYPIIESAKWGGEIMENREVYLPPEINRFFIPKNSFKEILGKQFGGEIKSISVDDDEVDIIVPTGFLKEALGEKYDRVVDEVEEDDGEIGISVSPQESSEKTMEESENYEEKEEQAEREYNIPP